MNGFSLHIGHCICLSTTRRSVVPDISEAEPEKVNSASPDGMCPQPWLSFIRLDDDEQCEHLIESRLKLSVSLLWGNLLLSQRNRAAVSHPSVARSSSVGMGLQVARPVTPSSSHAPTLCALARRIFSVSDKVTLVDNQ